MRPHFSLWIVFLSFLSAPCLPADPQNPYAVTAVHNDASLDFMAELEALSQQEGQTDPAILATKADALVLQIKGFPTKIAAVPSERLAKLSPWVAVVVLSHADLDTLARWRREIPSDQYRSAWSQLVNVAEVHRATLELKRSPPKNWYGWATLGNLLLSVSMIAYSQQKVVELDPATTMKGAVALLVTMMGTHYGTWLRDSWVQRRHRARQDKARMQLEEAIAFSKDHSLPLAGVLEGWEAKFDSLLQCADHLRSLR